jgi:hypothetical protein
VTKKEEQVVSVCVCGWFGVLDFFRLPSTLLVFSLTFWVVLFFVLKGGGGDLPSEFRVALFWDRFPGIGFLFWKLMQGGAREQVMQQLIDWRE